MGNNVLLCVHIKLLKHFHTIIMKRFLHGLHYAEIFFLLRTGICQFENVKRDIYAHIK